MCSIVRKRVLCGSISLKVSVLFDMNSGKKCVLLFCIDSQVLELFHMKSSLILNTLFYFLMLINTILFFNVN